MLSVEVRAIGVSLSPELHAYATKRVVASVGRLVRGHVRIRVRLSDVNGPKGGVDRRTMILLSGVGREVLVDTVGHDAFASIDAACARLASATSRRHGRRTAHRVAA